MRDDFEGCRERVVAHVNVRSFCQMVNVDSQFACFWCGRRDSWRDSEFHLMGLAIGNTFVDVGRIGLFLSVHAANGVKSSDCLYAVVAYLCADGKCFLVNDKYRKRCQRAEGEVVLGKSVAIDKCFNGQCSLFTAVLPFGFSAQLCEEGVGLWLIDYRQGHGVALLVITIAYVQSLGRSVENVRLVKSDGVPTFGCTWIAAASSADGSACKIFARQARAHPDTQRVNVQTRGQSGVDGVDVVACEQLEFLFG